MPKIQSASNSKQIVSRTITLHLRIGYSRTHVTLGVEDKLIVPVMLETTLIDRLIKSVHLT